MKQTNKIKAFLTVLATTTALSSGFAVTWENGKIQLAPAEQSVIRNEYGKFTGNFSGINYYLSQFKGQLEQELGTELSHDDFASILEDLGYGTDTDAKQARKTERTKLLGILQQPVFTETWDILSKGSKEAITKEYGNSLSGFNKVGSGYTLGQFKGKIEEILGSPISLGAFESILEGLGHISQAADDYLDKVKKRPGQQPVGSDLSQSGTTGQHSNPPTHQTQSSVQPAPQTTPTAAKFDRAAYIAAQIAARKAKAQGTPQSQQPTQSSAQPAPQTTPIQTAASQPLIKDDTQIIEALHTFGEPSYKIETYQFAGEKEKNSFIEHAIDFINSYPEEQAKGHDENTKNYLSQVHEGAKKLLAYLKLQPGQHQQPQASDKTFPKLIDEQWGAMALILHNIGVPGLVLDDKNVNDFHNRLEDDLKMKVSIPQILHYLEEFNTWYAGIDHQVTKEQYFQAHEGAKKLLAYLQQQQSPQGIVRQSDLFD